MFASGRFVAAFIALFATTAVSRAAAAMADDIFTGTLKIERGKAILYRCDAAKNRYLLIDRRADETRALTEYAAPVGAVFDVIGKADDDGSETTLTVTEISARIPRPLCHMIDIDAMFAQAAAQPVDPYEKFDLVALLECRSDADTAARFRNWLNLDPKVLATAALTMVSSRNFTAEYRIDAPITVFGHKTTTLALHPDGFLGVFGDIAPERMAQDVGAVPMLAANPFIAQKIIQAPHETGVMPGEVAVRVLSVTSRQGLPGKTVAGCLYLLIKNGGL